MSINSGMLDAVLGREATLNLNIVKGYVESITFLEAVQGVTRFAARRFCGQGQAIARRRIPGAQVQAG
jgi:hypothetical protein